MKRPNLFQGMLVAAALTGVAYSLGLLVPRLFYFWVGMAFDAILATVTALYILYVLARSRVRTGRLAVGSLALLALGGATLATLQWPFMIVLCVGLIWVSRALYAYSSLLGAAADGFLCVLALGVSVGGYSMSGSLAWGVWCFFLAQALFALIPEKGPEILGVAPGASGLAGESSDGFERSHAAAEMALRQLALRD